MRLARPGLIALGDPAGLVEKEVVQRLLRGLLDRAIGLERPPRPATRQTARSQVTSRLSPRDAPNFFASL